MTDPLHQPLDLAGHQQALRARCRHPTGAFWPFQKAELEQSLLARFEQQVRRHRDRVAFRSKHRELTYDALNRAANRVARAIVAGHGDGQEPVALLLSQDESLITAILGVLKAGKIAAPLDPALPPARITAMLADLQARLILTNSQHLSLARTVAGDADALLNIEAIEAGVATENLDLPISPDAPSAIIYTSGSIGLPKGVVQNHRHVLHNIMKHTNGFHICADDRMTLLASWTTAQALTYIYSALLNGAGLYMPDIQEVGLGHLAAWLIQQEITIYCSIPTIFRHFLDTLSTDVKFPTLRLIHLGGEPLYKKEIELYQRFFAPDCILVNRLGITETGSICWYLLDKGTPITGSIVTVGYALEDTEVLVLDEDGREVGVGQVGEIAVKSRYLTLGYWRKPELTEATFAPDPAGGPARVYRTGDLGRMLPDGCLEYLGREDFQVKIRGHRIQAAEVETALRDSALVKEAVATPYENRQGDTRLAAYVVPAQPPGPTSRELRRIVQERLPSYMVPSAFVSLTALPLLPSGKVDRRALPPLDQVGLELPEDVIAPRTPTEARLAEIWEELLGVEPVDVNDDFFALGGHSLLATQLLARVHEAFDVELSLQAFFDGPTIAALAAALTQRQAGRIVPAEMQRLLAAVEALSDDQAQRLLADERASHTPGAVHE
jgi:amino acid adenylation domain-containing protein